MIGITCSFCRYDFGLGLILFSKGRIYHLCISPWKKASSMIVCPLMCLMFIDSVHTKLMNITDKRRVIVLWVLAYYCLIGLMSYQYFLQVKGRAYPAKRNLLNFRPRNFIFRYIFGSKSERKNEKLFFTPSDPPQIQIFYQNLP